MTTDQFLKLDLTDLFNLDAISTQDNPGKGKLDGQFGIPAEDLPGESEFSAFDIEFALPEIRNTAKNCLIPRDQIIQLPEDNYSAIFFLGTSVYGSSRTSIEFHRNSGDVVQQSAEILQLTDWCQQAQFDELKAIHSEHRYSSAGKAEQPISIWLQVIFLPKDKSLRSIKIGSNPNMRIFAITLGKGAYKLPAENHLHYLLARLSQNSKIINNFNWLYRSLLDASSIVESEELRHSLQKVQTELQQNLNMDLLFENDLQHAELLFQNVIPELTRIRGEIAEKLVSEALDTPLKVRTIGHSHLDAVWLWPWNETVSKTFRTFSKNVARMERHPDFTFVASSAQYYEWVETYDPDLFEKIKKLAKEGRWEFIGGMWVESDGNIPSGESLVRQRLYGQRYFLKHFGRVSEVEWIPDTFGMHNNHPQIIRKTGGKYFFTTKLSWNYDNEFPYQHFIWESPDGSRVLALQNSMPCGVGPGPYDWLEESVSKHNVLLKPGHQAKVNCKTPYIGKESQSKEFIPEVLAIYGEGDGGEGPSDKFIQRAQILSMNSHYKHGTAHDHFHSVEKQYMDRIPVWNDELYLENHRGTTSSQERIKKLNKKAEAALLSAEKWNTLVQCLSGRPAILTELSNAWKKLLFNQFHDILPGTSIAQAYVDSELDFDQVFKTCNSLQDSALTSIAARINTSKSEGGNQFSTGRTLILFNSLAWEREDIVCVPWGFPWVRIMDLQDKEIPSQVTYRDGQHWLLFHTKVPAFGYTQVRLIAREKEAEAGDLSISDLTAENAFYRLKLDENGNIQELFDKELGRNLLKCPANQIQFFKNQPKEWSNWNIDPDFEKHQIQVEGDVRIEIIDRGPVVAAFRIEMPAAHDGKTVLEIRLYSKLKRIDFITEVDVNYRESLVKAAFPLNLGAEVVTTETSYGTYDRPTIPTTPFEKAKIELWTQKWLDLSGEHGGVSLMSLNQYGFDVNGDQVRLTLVKGGIDPDANTDVYKHRLNYALTSHDGDWKQSRAWQKGYEYNFPITAVLESEHEGELPASHSFGSISPNNVCWEAFKPEEEGNGLVIRVYELQGKDTENAVLTLPFTIHDAEEIDFLELNSLQKLHFSKNSVHFSIGHNEIKAIRVFKK